MRSVLSQAVQVAVACSALAVAAQDTGAQIDAFLRGHASLNRFAGVVLVAQRGSVIFERAYGLASVELNVPNGPHHRFAIGSITKQVTAATILKLQEQGRLHVTDAFCKYVENCPESWRAIAIHHLLSHTSGIPYYGAGRTDLRKLYLQPATLASGPDLVREKHLLFTPGEGWSYSNTGYLLLGQVIERVTGQKYHDYIEQHILQPLGMNDTRFDRPLTIMPNRASGYRLKRGTEELGTADFSDPSWFATDTGLYSTARDLYRWDRALSGDRFLSKQSRAAMFTPVREEYGYGTQLTSVLNRRQAGHSGAMDVYSSALLRFPDEDATIIVLSNYQGGRANTVGQGLAAIIFGDEYQVPQPRTSLSVRPDLLDAYVGDYSDGRRKVVISKEDGRLAAVLSFTGGAAWPKAKLSPFALHQFGTRDLTDYEIEFVMTEGGTPGALKIWQGGPRFTLKRLAR